MRRVAVAFLLALLTGCSVTSTRDATEDVARMVRERSGYEVAGAADEIAARERVKTLLSADLTPEAAVEVALLSNKRVTATLERIGVARADWARARLLANPVLDAEARFFRGEGTGVEFGIVQNVLDLVFVPLRSRVAEEAFLATKAEVSGELIGFASDVKLSLLAAQAAAQKAELWAHVAQATGASAEFARRLRKAGNVTALEQMMEEAEAAETRIQLAEANEAVVHARERVNALLGLSGSDTTWRLPARLPELPGEELSDETVERKAVEASFSLAAKRHEVEAAGVTMGFSRPLSLFGDVHVGLSGEREPDGAEGLGPAVSFPIPLFDYGGAVSEAAGAEFRQKVAEYTALAVETRAAARSAWARAKAARARALYYRDTVLPLRSGITRETQKEFNAMFVGAFQLLTAKRQEVEAGSRYVSSLHEYWAAKTALERILAGAAPLAMSESGEAGGREAGRKEESH